MRQILIVVIALIAKITVAQNQINFKTPNGVYPEGIAYYAAEDSFLISSITNGDIGIVNKKGIYKKFISNENFFSTVGLKIKGDKLYVAVGDLGLSKKSNKKSPKTIARLLIFNLKTKRLLSKIDLHDLYKGNHWANDLAIANNGDVYITDSFSPVIYKVTAKGKASVFIEDDKFLGKGINLNGILVHPKGYLLVAKNSDGKLFKIDLASKKIKEVILSKTIVGIDGLLLLPNGDVLVGQNTNFEAYHKLVSNDDFSTAYIKSSDTKGLDFATTATLVNGEAYFLNSYISDLFKGENTRTSYFIRKYTAIYPSENIVQELNFKKIKEETFGNKISRKVIPSNEGTLAIYTLEKGAHIPKHSHPQQQTTYIRSGKVKIIINGNEERILKAGDVIVIPGNISHEFFVLEKTEDIDVFSPKREPDWILGKSKFLKESK